MCKGSGCTCKRTNRKAFSALFPTIDIACKGLAKEKLSAPVTPTTQDKTKKSLVKGSKSKRSKCCVDDQLAPCALSNEKTMGTTDSSRSKCSPTNEKVQSTQSANSTSSSKQKQNCSANPEMTKKKHLRHYVQHDYHDHSQDPPPIKDSTTHVRSIVQKTPCGSVVTPFPLSLHNLLMQVEEDNMEDVIAWRPHGRSFAIKNSNKFVKDVIPKHFKQTRLSSFQRQLNLYGFHRITKKGPDRNSYYHEFFLRGRPYLCINMRRIRIKGTGVRTASSPESEPDFSKMDALELTRVSESPVEIKKENAKAKPFRSGRKKRKAKSQHVVPLVDPQNGMERKLPANKQDHRMEDNDELFVPLKSPTSPPTSPEPPFQNISPIPLEIIPSLFSERTSDVPDTTSAALSTSPEPIRSYISAPTPLPPTYDREQIYNFLRPVINPTNSIYLACPPMNASGWREIFGESMEEEEIEKELQEGGEEEKKQKHTTSETQWDSQVSLKIPAEQKKMYTSSSSKAREESLASFLADIDFETDNDGYFSDSGFARLLEKSVE